MFMCFARMAEMTGNLGRRRMLLLTFLVVAG